MNVPKNLKYTKEHEWIKVEDGNATIGITDYAQEHLGDITYVELPEIDAEFSKGDELSTIESVKAASDVYSPIAGTVKEINEDLDESPELINTDPYEAGWICVLSDIAESDLDELMNADEYEAFLEEAE